MERAFHEILGRHPSTAVALACHAGPIRALVGAALGLSPERAFQLACEHGSVTTLDFGRAPYCAAEAGDKPPPYGGDK